MFEVTGAHWTCQSLTTDYPLVAENPDLVHLVSSNAHIRLHRAHRRTPLAPEALRAGSWLASLALYKPRERLASRSLHAWPTLSTAQG